VVKDAGGVLLAVAVDSGAARLALSWVGDDDWCGVNTGSGGIVGGVTLDTGACGHSSERWVCLSVRSADLSWGVTAGTCTAAAFAVAWEWDALVTVAVSGVWVPHVSSTALAVEASVQVVTHGVSSALLLFWHQIVLALINVGALGAVWHQTEFTLALEVTLCVDTLHTGEWIAGVESLNVTFINIFADTTVGSVTLWTGAGSVLLTVTLGTNNLTDNVVAWINDAVAVVILHESFVADTASLEVVLPDAAVFGGGAVVISLDCLVVAGTCDLHVAGLCVDLISFLEVLIVVEATASSLWNTLVSVLHCSVGAVAGVVTVGGGWQGVDWLEDCEAGGWLHWTAIQVDFAGWTALLGCARWQSRFPSGVLDVPEGVAVLGDGLGEVADTLTEAELLVTSIHHTGESELVNLSLGGVLEAFAEWRFWSKFKELVALLLHHLLWEVAFVDFSGWLLVSTVWCALSWGVQGLPGTSEEIVVVCLLSLKSWAGRSHGPVILFLVVEVTTHTAGLAVLADWHVDFHNVHTVPLELESGDQVDFNLVQDSGNRDDVSVVVLLHSYTVDKDNVVLEKRDVVANVVELKMDGLDPGVISSTDVTVLPVLNCDSVCSLLWVLATVLGHDVLAVSLVVDPLLVEADAMRISEAETLSDRDARFDTVSSEHLFTSALVRSVQVLAVSVRVAVVGNSLTLINLFTLHWSDLLESWLADTLEASCCVLAGGVLWAWVPGTLVVIDTFTSVGAWECVILDQSLALEAWLAVTSVSVSCVDTLGVLVAIVETESAFVGQEWNVSTDEWTNGHVDRSSLGVGCSDV